jgi:hypothetical protein
MRLALASKPMQPTDGQRHNHFIAVRTHKTHTHRIARLVLAAVGCLLLLILSVDGFRNAMRNARDLHTAAQYLMTISQFSYAALGPCVVILRIFRLRWLTAVWRAWAVLFIAAIAMIPVAWIEPSLLQTLGFAITAVASAGLMRLLVFCGANTKTPHGAANE